MSKVSNKGLKKQLKEQKALQLAHQRFDDFYQSFYFERWPELKKSLLADHAHALWKNPFCQKQIDLKMAKVSSFLETLYLPDDGHRFESDKGDVSDLEASGLRAVYLLDLASALAPWALGVKRGDRVLDLCAAPGGKSLLLAQALFTCDDQGELICNERSSTRKKRLERVLREYLPEQIREKIKTTEFDATSWCLLKEEEYKNFDKILLDAPCSSERHVLSDNEHMARWAVGRSKNLAKDQWAMLSSAWQALKVGGELVYSTCALSNLENDQVIEKLLQKRSDAKLVDLQLPLGEKTSFGVRILPDRDGWGPFYLAKVKKVEDSIST